MRAANSAATALLLLALAGVASAQSRPADRPPAKAPPGGSLSRPPQTFGGRTLEDWQRDLTSGEASKRALAITAIMSMGEESARFVPLLIERTRDRDSSPRTKAVIALRFVAVHKDHVPRVVAALAARVRHLKRTDEGETIVRYEAVASLERFAADAQSAIPALIEGTTDWSNWEIRRMSIRVLVHAGMGKDGGTPDPHVSLALVKRMLSRTEDYQVQLEAVKGLGAMGRPDPSARREVLEALHSVAHSRPYPRNMPLKIWAFTALANMNESPEAAIAGVTGFLRHTHLEVRCQAAQALGALGKKAKDRVPRLIRMLSDRQPPAVEAACIALGNIGDDGDKVIEALLRTLEEKKDPNVTLAVCGALLQLKAARADVFAALDRQMKRVDKESDNLKPFIRRTRDQLKNPRKDEPAARGGGAR